VAERCPECHRFGDHGHIWGCSRRPVHIKPINWAWPWRRSARDVLDYLAWMEHCLWVNGICDDVYTAMAVFDSFKRSASAERGRAIRPPARPFVLPKPDDPVFTGSVYDCVIGDHEEGCEGSVQPRSEHRIAAMRSFADSFGCDLANVSCTAGHMRLLTRQDSWDERGRDDWGDELYDNWVSEHGRPPTAAEEDEIDTLEPPEIVPVEWEWRDHYPAWEYCKAEADGAIAVWFCEWKPSKKVAA
jgi:hypothetical protein